MAGDKQIIMLSPSMVVIAALAGGLGEPVVTGLGQRHVGTAFIGGIGIVIIAIMLDRVTAVSKKGGILPRKPRNVDANILNSGGTT